MKPLKNAALLLSLMWCCSFNSTATTFEKDTTYTTHQTWQKLQKIHPEIKIIYSMQDKNLISKEDVLYKTISGENGEQRNLKLDIYRPAQKGKYPALIMIHGGGWQSGNKSMERPMAQRIALQGFVSIPVEYRLSLEARYPAAIHDIKAAIRWIKDNSEKYDIDTTRIAIEGESAGGQLAMLVAMTNNVDKFEGDKAGSNSTSTVHAAIDVDGIVSFLMPGSLNIERKPDSPDAFWLGGTFAEKPLIWKDASPLFWVEKRSVPCLFIASSVPRFHAGRDEMIDLLNQNGIYSESHTISETPHSFWLFQPWFTPTMDNIVGFLNRVFEK